MGLALSLYIYRYGERERARGGGCGCWGGWCSLYAGTGYVGVRMGLVFFILSIYNERERASASAREKGRTRGGGWLGRALSVYVFTKQESEHERVRELWGGGGFVGGVGVPCVPGYVGVLCGRG